MGGSHPLFQSPAKNALLFFVLLWYIGLEIVKAALKSSIFLFFLEQLCYFNLSPQGDGNGHLVWANITILDISTYPRKGTETINAAIGKKRAEAFQLIPARGRKLESSHESIRMDKFQLIPARGRKHLMSEDHHHNKEYFNLSPQGDENHVVHHC